MDTPKEISRKQFLRRSAGLAMACCGFGMLAALEGCSSARTITSAPLENGLSVAIADFQEDNMVMIDDKRLDAPLALVRKNEKTFVALLMVCTHKACTIRPAGSIFQCPCHGSEFSKSGQVLKGPADEPLLRFPATLEGDKITISFKTQS